MKSLLLAVCCAVLGLSLVIGQAVAASSQEDKNKSDNNKNSVQQKKPNKAKDQSLKQTPKVTNNIPVYKPPLRGAPAGRVAGGTRGPDQEFPYLCLIVPEHIGLTISRQPVLYFYQSKTSPFPIEFTLIPKQGISPIVETRITPSAKAGIQSVRLADYGVSLEVGIHYKWFIALIPDSHHRSKDILAAGGIELIEQPEKIKNEIEAAKISRAPHIYADAGLWYDAFYTLSSLIEKSPDDPNLRKQRASLLEQIGLAQVARHDTAE